METTVRLYAPDYTEKRTYWLAVLFAVGNIVLPQLFHLVPQGGVTWLPIYFFTLVGAYKYGWRVGLLTAVLSPCVNSWWFGMPAAAVLPAILLKSVLLALLCGFPFPPGQCPASVIGSVVLSSAWHLGRMGYDRRFRLGRTRFSYRLAWNGFTDSGWLLDGEICNL